MLYTWYWLIKIFRMPDTRYPKICFNRMYHLSTLPSCKAKYNWCCRIREFLEPVGYMDLWGNFDADLLEDKTVDVFRVYESSLITTDINDCMNSMALQLPLPRTMNFKANYLLKRCEIVKIPPIAQLRLLSRL